MSKLAKQFSGVATMVAATLFSMPASAESLGLGRVATPAEIAAWDIDIRPDGAGLPDGQGTPLEGETVFNDQCASCHGDFGEGVDRWPQLVGGFDTLTEDRPVKTVGSYWPYASTIFDYVHRAMPFGAAQTLSDDEVYAITAYLLYMNDVIEDDEFVLSRESFNDFEMPNVEGFTEDNRDDVMLKGEPCMTDCTPKAVKVTMRAAVLDVTPDVEGGEPQASAAEVPKIDVALAEKGAKVFRKCKACHQVGEGAKNRVGPILSGILGREAGALDGFKYSKAMTKAADGGLIWSPDTVSSYIEKPRAFMKGTKMSFGGIRKEDDRLAVIEYLKQFE